MILCMLRNLDDRDGNSWPMRPTSCCLIDPWDDFLLTIHLWQRNPRREFFAAWVSWSSCVGYIEQPPQKPAFRKLFTSKDSMGQAISLTCARIMASGYLSALFRAIFLELRPAHYFFLSNTTVCIRTTYTTKIAIWGGNLLYPFCWWRCTWRTMKGSLTCGQRP